MPLFLRDSLPLPARLRSRNRREETGVLTDAGNSSRKYRSGRWIRPTPNASVPCETCLATACTSSSVRKGTRDWRAFAPDPAAFGFRVDLRGGAHGSAPQRRTGHWRPNLGLRQLRSGTPVPRIRRLIATEGIFSRKNGGEYRQNGNSGERT